MIRSWGHDTARDIWQSKNTKAARRIPENLWERTRKRLALLDAATSLQDLKSVSLGLHVLAREQKGRHGIKINDQYRVTFRWESRDAHEARTEDYH